MKEESLEIADYLEEELVTFLDVNSRIEAVTALVDLLEQQGKLKNRDAFLQAILEREKIVSTGIGIGVAIPHAKMETYDDFFIAIGVQKTGGIEWEALDQLPVRIVFMIGGPANQQAEYLNILSMITAAIKDEKKRKALLSAPDAASVIATLQKD